MTGFCTEVFRWFKYIFFGVQCHTDCLHWSLLSLAIKETGVVIQLYIDPLNLFLLCFKIQRELRYLRNSDFYKILHVYTKPQQYRIEILSYFFIPTTFWFLPSKLTPIFFKSQETEYLQLKFSTLSDTMNEMSRGRTFCNWKDAPTSCWEITTLSCNVLHRREEVKLHGNIGLHAPRYCNSGCTINGCVNAV